MIRTDKIIVVEGKYDRHTLANYVDASIIETGGFGIFKNKELKNLLQTLAKQRGIILLTDSDYAGLAIRNYIRSIVDTKYITNVYIPDIQGKEKRKKRPSKEGTLGVEGMDEQTIIRAFAQAGVLTENTLHKKFLTKATLYHAGLSGKPNSGALREQIKKYLNLPRNLSVNRLLDMLNLLVDEKQFIEMMNQIRGEKQ